MNKLMKTAAGVAVLGLSSVALAGGGGMAPPVDDTGWYIGGSLGFGLSYWDNIQDGAVNGTTTVTLVGKEDDFAARAHVGYNFNHYYALEFGYTFLPSDVNFTTTALPGGADKMRNWAFDLSGKLSVPLTMMDEIGSFGVFARLGIDYLRTTMRGTLALPGNSPLVGGATRARNWNVTYGSGIYYDYSPQVRLTAEWQRFHGKSRAFKQKYQPFMDTFTFGLSYRLPDGLLI